MPVVLLTVQILDSRWHHRNRFPKLFSDQIRWVPANLDPSLSKASKLAVLMVLGEHCSQTTLSELEKKFKQTIEVISDWYEHAGLKLGIEKVSDDADRNVKRE